MRERKLDRYGERGEERGAGGGRRGAGVRMITRVEENVPAMSVHHLYEYKLQGEAAQSISAIFMRHRQSTA